MNFFTDEENKSSYLYKRKVIHIPESKSIIEIGLYPVMFGWRIRGGLIDSSKGHATAYPIDLCAGDNPKHISLIYTTALNTIIRNLKKLEKEANYLILSSIFPVFDIKPIVNDLNFPEFLLANIGGIEKEEVQVSEEQLAEWRRDFMDHFNFAS